VVAADSVNSMEAGINLFSEDFSALLKLLSTFT
jgi:hypothetical protein